MSTIGRLDIKTRKWTNAGSLVTGRHGHNAIHDGQFVLVVGGSRTKKTEKCSIANERVTCASQSPELTDYSYYPELFLVTEGFCEQLYWVSYCLYFYWNKFFAYQTWYCSHYFFSQFYEKMRTLGSLILSFNCTSYQVYSTYKEKLYNVAKYSLCYYMFFYKTDF